LRRFSDRFPFFSLVMYFHKSLHSLLRLSWSEKATLWSCKICINGPQAIFLTREDKICIWRSSQPIFEFCSWMLIRRQSSITTRALHRPPYWRFYGRHHHTVGASSKFGPYTATA
jgi:hypothetical protein